MSNKRTPSTPMVAWEVRKVPDPDLLAEYTRLCAEYEALPETQKAKRKPLEARIADMLKTFEAEKFTGRFRKESYLAWEAFKGEHPVRMVDPDPPLDAEGKPAPKTPHEDDDGWGFNASTLFPAAVRKYMVEPMDDDEWDEFCVHVSGSGWQELGALIYVLNERSVVAPKPPAGYPTTTPRGSV